MNANDLRNAMLALNSINYRQFWEATLPQAVWGTTVSLACYDVFAADPWRFYTNTTDAQREGLFALIQKHLDEGKTND